MNAETSFGRWLRHRRRQLDLTQDELAQRVGCSVVTVRKIETDERRPSKQIAARLAACLDIPSADRPAFLQAARAELAAAGLDLAPPLAGAAPPRTATPALPSGTVTFLFTDIEGSTQLWERHLQVMPAALARHDAILMEAIAARSGVVVKRTGDGFLAAFAHASDALAAALSAQRALQTEDWRAAGLSHAQLLQVRMALHTGVAEEREGDYLGAPLNRAARLLAAAHGGQLLLSRATWELVADHLPADVDLRDLGVHRLKDLTRPEQIFQLVAPDLPADFPPLRSLDRHASHLPAQPTALIGREREVAAVCQLFRRRDVRLLTLSGPGGVGKTRLALQVAAEMLDEFAHGASFVALAAISDPGLVVSTIVQTLGLREASGQPLPDMIKAYLHDKRLLLLLDNFEQVLAAAPVLADLLAACPQLKLLVTSREMLHLSGEHVFPVPPLTLPEPQQLLPTEAGLVSSVSKYEAVRLFIVRAQAVKPDFQVTNANAPAVAEICYRLDGLPLAIELAAARVRLFPPQALLARLSSPLTLLTGGARDLPERQQTLRQTIDWSYSLLDAGEQTLFARLGVFAGGCTLEAAKAVCNPAGDLRLEVLDGLASLMDKSLLRQEEGMAPRGYPEPRFTMLETIREYALEQLEASGEAALIKGKHAQFFLVLAEAVEPELQGPEHAIWVEQLTRELDNLRAALRWTLESGEIEIGLRLAGALWWFWHIQVHWNEGRAWLAALLSRTDAAEPTLERAKALTGAGRLAWNQGDYSSAYSPLEESLAINRTLGDKRGTAYALNYLGILTHYQGNLPIARSRYEQSLALWRELGDRAQTANVLNNLGAVTRELGDYGRGRLLHEESLALNQAIGYKRGIALVLVNLGEAAYHQGDYNSASSRHEEALAMRKELDDRVGIAAIRNQLGYVALHQGDNIRSAALFAESLMIEQELGNKWEIAWCLEGLAAVAAAAGLHSTGTRRAAQLFGAAEALREAIGAPVPSLYGADVAQNIAAVRAQLDEATFAAAWTAGRAMPLEQAIAYALADDNHQAHEPYVGLDEPATR